MKRDGAFHVIYSPRVMRRASTIDWKHWEITPMFACEGGAARDPYVFEEDGRLIVLWTEGRRILCRTAENLTDWSEPLVLQETFFPDAENESPFLMKKDGFYYLFWSLWDGRNGCYDERTLVFAAETLAGLRTAAPLTMLRGHAPEIVEADGAWYFLSVFYPSNGISAIKLNWE
jgi:hypothetical protein